MDPNDRRYIRVVLTPAGCELIQRVLPTHAEMVAGVFDVLGKEEMNTLGRLLKTLGYAAAANE
jgi:MarR family 2-MHQ and catechol resistance regulon transcriptional repressor